MEVESQRLEKALRKLRKAIKRLGPDPPPEKVHKLRTEARRVETIASALTPGDEITSRLLRSIKPLRKAAGSVRDLDVLTTMAINLSKGDHPMTGEDKQSQHSLTRLVEYLGGARQREAEKLLAAVERKQKPACRNIKRYKKLLQSTFADENPDTSPIALESQARSFASGMVAQLGRAKRLTARNIHPFRLKVRKLRSILELVPSSDPDLLRSLTRAKNEIGDWHDWHQLAATARQVLKQASDRPLLTRIDRIAARELSQAVEASEALRGTYLQPAPESRRPAKKRA